jgi:hypothetical protein
MMLYKAMENIKGEKLEKRVKKESKNLVREFQR